MANETSTEEDTPVAACLDREEALGRTRRRLRLACVAILVIAAGLLVHFTVAGPLGDSLADALYAVLVYLVVAFLLMRWASVVLALIAFVLCALIEFAQLTGVPAALSESFPPIRLLLGTTFVASDLLAYAVGAAVAGLADAVFRRAALRRLRGYAARTALRAQPPRLP